MKCIFVSGVAFVTYLLQLARELSPVQVFFGQVQVLGRPFIAYLFEGVRALDYAEVLQVIRNGVWKQYRSVLLKVFLIRVARDFKQRPHVGVAQRVQRSENLSNSLGENGALLLVARNDFALYGQVRRFDESQLADCFAVVRVLYVQLV